MDTGFVDDLVVISRPIFRFSLYFSLLFGNLSLETGSNPTASSASQSGLCNFAINSDEEARR
jgi:hypothetical protein